MAAHSLPFWASALQDASLPLEQQDWGCAWPRVLGRAMGGLG